MHPTTPGHERLHMGLHMVPAGRIPAHPTARPTYPAPTPHPARFESALMLVGYATFLIFQLVTHRYLYDGDLMAGEAPIKVAAAAAISVSRQASTGSGSDASPRLRGAGGPPPRPLLQQALAKSASAAGLQGGGGGSVLSQRRVSVLAMSDLELIPLGPPPGGGGGGGGAPGECRIEVAAAEAAAAADSVDSWGDDSEGAGLIGGRGGGRAAPRGAAAEVRAAGGGRGRGRCGARGARAQSCAGRGARAAVSCNAHRPAAAWRASMYCRFPAKRAAGYSGAAARNGSAPAWHAKGKGMVALRLHSP
jgi:hypothetical protein